MHRCRRNLLSALALVAAAGVLAGCVYLKPESLQLSQPGGIGSVRVQVGLCNYKPTLGEEVEPCQATSGESQEQLMLAFAVPNGTGAPATITASPGPGAEPITYARSQEVTDRLLEEDPKFPDESTEWPPSGTEVVGYLSEVRTTKPGDDFEWTVDVELGLPDGAGGGAFPGPFLAAVVAGVRIVDEENPASRPYHCHEGETPEIRSWCGGYEEAEIAVSDLRLEAPAAVRALAGGRASIEFGLDFATSASPPPTFALSTGTTLRGASTTVGGASFDPTASGRSSRTVSVTVPKQAKAGAYEVTLTAATPSGGTVSGPATLNVARPRIQFGKLRRNRAKGTAIFPIKVSDPGTLKVFGRKLKRAERKPKAGRLVRVVIRAKGRAKRLLNRKGSAKVVAKVRLKPRGGAAVARSKAIKLIKRR